MIFLILTVFYEMRQEEIAIVIPAPKYVIGNIISFVSFIHRDAPIIRRISVVSLAQNKDTPRT